MKIPELKYTHLYQTNATIGKNRNDQVSKISYKTMAVHKEYGHPDIPNARSDIVILNPNDILEIDDPLDLKVRKKWIVPDYIFEFGTEKAAGSETVFKEHLENDIEKACKSNKRGYIIHIQRNMCESEGELLKNNRSKYEGYSHVITNITREIFARVFDARKFRILIKSNKYYTEKISKHYCDEPVGELVTRFNTLDLLEVAINGANLCQLFSVDTGDTVRVEAREAGQPINGLFKS